MQSDATEWSALGYDETDRVSITRYLGSLGCRTDDALLVAARHQHPLSPELAKLLVDAGCDPVAQDDGGWNALGLLADGGRPVDPQVTNLFLSAGCRTDLDGCDGVSDKTRFRFNQILKEHAQWKESLDRMSAENSPANLAVDWNR